MKIPRQHEVLTETSGSQVFHPIRLQSGPYEGIIFTYGMVKLVEDGDSLILKFDYDVHEVPEGLEDYDADGLEKELGDFLVELIEYGLMTDTLGVTDGTDRKDDPQ